MSSVFVCFFVSAVCVAGDFPIPSFWRHEGDDSCDKVWCASNPQEFGLKKLEIAYEGDWDVVTIENAQGASFECRVDRPPEVLSACQFFSFFVKNNPSDVVRLGRVMVFQDGGVVYEYPEGTLVKKHPFAPAEEYDAILYDVRARYLRLWKCFGRWGGRGDYASLSVAVPYDDFSTVSVDCGWRSDTKLIPYIYQDALLSFA